MILDIGCGTKPRGDVNIDLLIPNDDYRQMIKPKSIHNFIMADAHYLPFKNKCFEQAYCSHLLEHLEHPEKVIDELKRVSNKKIFLIVPFAIFEIASFLPDPWKIFWRKQHHKRFYWCNPFKKNNVKFRYIGLKSAILRKVNFQERIKFPIPFETETVINIE